MKNIQLNCEIDNEVKLVIFPLIAKKTKINKTPKNILPKATILDGSSFNVCFDMIVSKLHNKTAAKIKNSPKPKLKDLVISNNKLPVKSKIAANTKLILGFSFNNKKAKIETKINMDLWINEEEALAEIDNPLKKSKNGIEPPKKPIATSLNHCFLARFFTTLNSFSKIMAEKRNKTTKTFFEKVKT